MKTVSQQTQQAGWVSIVSNLLLFGLKYWVGILTGSIALLADAWHTLTDSITSLVVILGAWLAGKPADDDHPFGHGRAEHIATVIIGVLLAIIGFEFLVKSVVRLQAHESVTYGKVAIAVTITSVVIKEILAQYTFWIARKTKSSVLRADAWHHRSDAFSSLIILIGIFLGPHFWWIDGVLGIVVAMLIFYTAYEVVKADVSSLLGEKPNPEMIERVKQMANQRVGRDVNLHHFHLHRYGHHSELSFHIKLPGYWSLEEAHQVCTEIELEVKEQMEIITTIHAEPMED